ncbi:molybdopterin molybdotransferase MoeA [candidate division KSB1 bacterium]|nr:molybdopterin molybdotransferase MoeA [candidate division KSB1 bacterium]NIR72828.1 molybdopterin molybdotransferase MoeA [candidate division KSB1 bacterium]NIS26868.1 molybdopterin molybdotransferase MoeA [candidate division KSB1 bacterium]NIT73664.1 molybdopterin molybdotransferase MoeA [candidate division KSB1 bacterium]NIU27535.1 molybdopterin molybdotransferase MoeA [candidate division KSB1 bacterium]
MIPVQKAIEIALAETSPIGTETVSIFDVNGFVLAQDVYSDIDIPPWDKSAMDGYAFKHSDVTDAPVELRVVGFIPAGVYPEVRVGKGEAAKIMTGAPVPEGADTIQMVEKTQSINKEKVKILEGVILGNHVAKKAEVLRSGEKVLTKGMLISPAVIGVLATVGKREVEIFRRPTVGILVTGDELVEVPQTPRAGQIRNSNGYVLFNQVRECRATPEWLGIAPDNLDQLSEKIAHGLTKDILLISGGVSMGDLDLVEDVFANLGVKVLYDKVDIKPGKPSVFGTGKDTLVFGLPGNPVSASTVFEVIAKPVLRKMMGFEQVHSPKLTAILSEDFRSKTKRANYAPAWVHYQQNSLIATPIASKGSADVLAFAKSNAYMVIPGHQMKIKKGQEVDVLLRDEFWRTCQQSMI